MSKKTRARMRVRSRRRRRAAAILVWFALLLPLLLGMTGLVIDAGLLMSSHRHLQNAVDAAALAAASDLMNGLTDFEATSTARMFVVDHNGLAGAEVQVFSPPANGPYAGEAGYVEVLAEYETPTIFIQLLNGVHTVKTARARAVAGTEFNEFLDGIIALDSRSTGLAVTGNAVLNATGRIIVNSENGGVDQNGEPMPGGQSGFAAFVSPFAGVKASEVHVVGGVNRTDRFENIDSGGGAVLKTGQLPVSDPLSHLPVPTIANGVIDVYRGSPVATPDSLELNNPADDNDSPNYIETDEETGEQTLVLNPGIYSSIDITGGKVRFRPGIYVMAASREKTYSVRILAGEIEASGIMFYNTRDDYDPLNGRPDVLNGPPDVDGADTGQFRINAALGFSGIDTLRYAYGEASPLISTFNGMVVFQRRRNIATLQIQGFAQETTLEGAVYAKWANLRVPAGGVLDSQLVVGTLSVPGHGDLLIDRDSNDLLETPDVYLVE